jgi:hypothetical protein
MRNSWRSLLRRLAAGSIVGGCIAWSAAFSYAVQLAYDSADDPVYSDGWQEGDDGGAGFTGWNFDSGYWWQGTLYSYSHPGFLAVDDGLQSGTHSSNPHNQIGRSLVIGSHPDGDGAPRIGRGLDSPLGIGETLSVVVDNPTRRRFYGGYFIQFNGGTGGLNGNVCGGNDQQPHACTPGAPVPADQLNMWRFEYFDYGQWQIADDSNTYIPLFDTDTAAAGTRLDLTLTSASDYELMITPLGNPSQTHTHNGILRHPGESIDWFQITFFNPVTDTTPTLAEAGTDFYIRSMEVTSAAPPGVPGDYNDNGAVDAADYVLARKHLGTVFQLENEVPGMSDGSVTQADLDAWHAQFGSSGVAGGLAAAAPEPATFVYVMATFGWVGLPRFLRH